MTNGSLRRASRRLREPCSHSNARTGFCPGLMRRLSGRPWGAVPNWFQIRELAVEMLLRVAGEDYLETRRDLVDDQPFRTMWYKS